MRGSDYIYSCKLLLQNELHRLYGRRPVVHQAPPTLEEIAARIGRLRGVLYRMGERGLDHFAGCACPFRGPVPEARPETHAGTAAMPSSLINFDSVVLESGFPRRLRNTRPVPSLRLRASCRIASARPESGTR